MVVPDLGGHVDQVVEGVLLALLDNVEEISGVVGRETCVWQAGFSLLNIIGLYN